MASQPGPVGVLNMAKRRGRSRSKGDDDEDAEDADEPQKRSKARSRSGGKRRAERLAVIEAQRRQKRNRLLTIVVIIVAVAFAASTAAFIFLDGGDDEEDGGNPIVVMETSYGTIEIELFMDVTPDTAGNFKDLVEQKFYDGLTFHRIVDNPDFKIIQGGDPSGDGSGGPGYTIDFEDSAGNLKHKRGSIAMARSQEKDSAGSQFYICINDIPQLDGEYAVFGHVVSGLEVVDTINQVATDDNGRPYSPVSMDPVYIKGQEEP
jgi:peptidyl-prolyl cis-trans isomerase B (cyclophilin B)